MQLTRVGPETQDAISIFFEAVLLDLIARSEREAWLTALPRLKSRWQVQSERAVWKSRGS